MYIKEVSQSNLKLDLPELRSGQTVRVHLMIKEPVIDAKTGKTTGLKDRSQIFEGQIIAIKHGRGLNATITVRRVASGVGVERILPIHSPTISKIEVVKNVRAKKAKLYYTREGKEAKVFSL